MEYGSDHNDPRTALRKKWDRLSEKALALALQGKISECNKMLDQANKIAQHHGWTRFILLEEG